jgi:hypothetical protein
MRTQFQVDEDGMPVRPATVQLPHIQPCQYPEPHDKSPQINYNGLVLTSAVLLCPLFSLASSNEGTENPQCDH